MLLGAIVCWLTIPRDLEVREGEEAIEAAAPDGEPAVPARAA